MKIMNLYVYIVYYNEDIIVKGYVFIFKFGEGYLV